MANLNIAIKIAAQDNASGPIGRITGALGSLGGIGLSGLQTIGTAAFGAIATGATLAAGAVVSFAAGGVQAAMEMEASLSNIAAVLGLTKEEAAPLGDLIADLGLNPNLKVTAEEAALAINNLATNGLNMTQIMEGAAESTVLLANSTGADFGTAANIATDSMAIFNIEAEEMMQAVNGITSVTVASKFGINDYGLALAQAGGVASAAGVEFGDFNTAITAISPLFASGSDAGTSFKTMLQRLVPASGPAAEAMAELGILAEDGSNAFFDAEGNLRDMAEIAGVMQNAFAGLSEEQRNEAMSTIFGSDAMRAAVGLMEVGEQGFRDLAETMSQTDAMESAATRMDNLSGVMEIIGGVFDAVQLKVGQAFLPTLRLLADNFLVLANNAGPAVIGFFEGIAATIAGLVPVFQNMGMAIQEGGFGALFTVFEDGSSHLGAFLEALGMTETAAYNLAAGFINLVTQVTTFFEPITTAVTQFVSWQDVLAALGIAIGAVIIPAIGSLLAAIAPVILTFAAVTAAVALVRTAWEQNWGGIQEKTQAVIDWIVPLITNAITTIQTWWAENGDAILLKASETWTAIQTAIETAITTIQTVVTTIYTAVSTFWAENGDAILTKATEVWTAVQTGIQTAITTVQTIITTVMTAIGTFWSAHGQTITAVATNTWNTIKNWVQSSITNIKLIIQAVSQAISGDWRGFGETLRDIWDNTWEALKNLLQGAVTNITTVVSDLVTSIKNFFTETDWGQLGTDIVDGILSGLESGASAIANKLTEIAEAAMAAWDGFWGNASPSKLMIKSAGFITGGVMVGWERTVGGLLDMVAGSGNELADAFFAPVAARVGSMGQGGMTLPPTNTQAVTNNYYQLQANYRQQDERTLRDDVRLLQLMGAAI